MRVWIIKNNVKDLTQPEINNITLLSNVMLEKGWDFSVITIGYVYEHYIIKKDVEKPDFIIYLADDNEFAKILKFDDLIVIKDPEGEDYIKDKNKFLSFMRYYNIPHLKTLFIPRKNSGENYEITDKEIDVIFEHLGNDIVIKSEPNFIEEINDKKTLKEKLTALENYKVILQERNKTRPGEDIVVYCVKGEAICAIKRKNNCNIDCDRKMQTDIEKIELNEELKRQALLICLMSMNDVCKINFLYAPDGKYYANKIMPIKDIKEENEITGEKFEERIIENGIACIERRKQIEKELANDILNGKLKKELNNGEEI